MVNTVLFYPDPPMVFKNHTSLSKIIRYFKNLNYTITNDPYSDWDIGVHWNYNDINVTSEIFINSNKPVINKNVNNVTKSYVDKVFHDVFGYSSMADTSRFGYCVKKSEKQSAHDGQIMKMPLKQDGDSVYQILIDNRMSIDTVYVIRIPIFWGKIPFVMIYKKSIEGTFERSLSKQRQDYVEKVSDVLSRLEHERIRLFCDKMGVDVAEIDALRDNSTGLLYLTDVNNLPGSDVYNRVADGVGLERLLTDCFDKQLKKWMASR